METRKTRRTRKKRKHPAMKKRLLCRAKAVEEDLTELAKPNLTVIFNYIRKGKGLITETSRKRRKKKTSEKEILAILGGDEKLV